MSISYLPIRLEGIKLPYDPSGSDIAVRMLAAPINPSDINMVCMWMQAWQG